MGLGRNHRRGQAARTETGPRYEGKDPGAGTNSTHVARSRRKWKSRAVRSERSASTTSPKVRMQRRTRPEVSTPNLVAESGRESLPLDERIRMLAADVAVLENEQVTRVSASSAYDYDFNSLIGTVKFAVALYAAQRAEQEECRYITSEVASDLECDVMAWRRGGHREFKRVRAARGAGSL